MPQPTKGPRLGGSPAHQRLILANLATSLFEHGKISTTEAKARRLRPYAERLITKAKRGDLHNRREISKVIRDKGIVHKLMADIGPFFADRDGGYTRITKTMPRKGDNAPMAVIELVSAKTVTDEANRARRAAASQKESAQKESAQKESAQKESAQQESAQQESAQKESAQKAAAAPAPVDEAAAVDETVVADTEVEESTATGDAPYGEGSHAPLDDASEAPVGFEIKGNADSMLYHVPGSSFYDRTVAEVWFASAEAAEAAGFALPASQREDASSEES